MKKFVYAPDVSAYVATKTGIIDLSEDIIEGEVQRNVDALSTARIMLQNPNKRYLGRIRPMDRIVIYLTRIHKPVLVFSGYIDKAPLLQQFPEPVTLIASCSLKRIKYTYWDPGLVFVVEWMAKHGWAWNPNSGTAAPNKAGGFNLDYEGGIGVLIRDVLNELGGWPIGKPSDPKNSVHVMKLPQQFITVTSSILKREMELQGEVQDQLEELFRLLTTAEGTNTDDEFSDLDSMTWDFKSSYKNTNPLPSSLAGNYTASIYGPPGIAAGFAQAFQHIMNSRWPQYGITPMEAKNAELIWTLAARKGYNYKARAGWVATAFRESGLDHRIASGTGTAVGLFQLDPGGGWFKPGSILAQVVKEVTGKTATSEAALRRYAQNATINTMTMMRDGAANVDAINNASNPARYIGENVSRHAKGLGSEHFTKEARGYEVAVRAYTQILNKVKPRGGVVSGRVGQVRVGDRRLMGMTGGPMGPPIQSGHTFRIKGNPYGKDDMVFQAMAHDPRLGRKEIAIYVPGAEDGSTPPAEKWGKGKKSVVIQSNNTKRTQTAAAPKPKNARQIPSGFPDDHGPRLKPAFSPSGKATDVFGDPGDAILAPEDGRITRYSGSMGTTSIGGAGGLSIYYVGKSGMVYYITHLQGRKPLGSYKYRDVIGFIGPGELTGTSPHAHVERASHAGAHALANSPSRGTEQGKTDDAGQTGPASSSVTAGGNSSDRDPESLAASVTAGLQMGWPTIASVLESSILMGPRALANDQSLLPWIEFMVKASGRSFQSWPNGDFFAFYPDYFNWSNQDPYFNISDIEIISLSVDIGDDDLVTHVFTTADTFRLGAVEPWMRMSATVASVNTLGFNDLISGGGSFDAAAFLNRYGARPVVENHPEIKNSFMQFMVGWSKFLEHWAKQFYCEAQFTFMPELYPGGLIEFDSTNIVMYINQVTHTFSRESGFTTTAQLMAPSIRGKGGSWSYGMALTAPYVDTGSGDDANAGDHPGRSPGKQAQ